MKLSLINRLVFCLLLLGNGHVLLGQQTAATAAATNAPGGRIQFASMDFDFGKVTVGVPVKHEFVFTNTGDTVLIVSNVQPTCGCTTAGAWSHEVAPGQTGIIPLQFNSNPNGVGQVLKNINVTTSDPEHQTLTLHLHGTVWSPIEVSPAVAFFNVAPDAISNSTVTVRIANNTDDPVTVSNLQNGSTNFTAELHEVKPGKEWQLVIKTVPPLPPGRTQGMVSLKTSSTTLPNIDIIASRDGAAGGDPVARADHLPPGPLTNAVTTIIAVQNNANAPLTLTEPAINNPKLDLQIKETTPGRTFTLTVVAPQGLELPPGQPVQLTVKSSSPQMPLITVPISPNGQSHFARDGKAAGSISRDAPMPSRLRREGTGLVRWNLSGSIVEPPFYAAFNRCPD